MLEFDVLVIGGGGAGLRAALEAARLGGQSVALLSKTLPWRSTTGSTGGGINAILPAPEVTEEQRQLFARDTLKGSALLADEAAVDWFVERSETVIHELLNFGVPFFRDRDGNLLQRKGGGGSVARVCLTHGHSIAHLLYEQMLRSSVQDLSGHFLLELVLKDGEVQGVLSFDQRRGEIVAIAAKSVIMATGGYSRIYWGRATTPLGATGDGIAACLNAGIAFKDPEFVQFHPTAIAGLGIMISEGARSEGARLYNCRNERFMQRYDAAAMELATRDLVSFAIEKEIQQGQGCQTELGPAVWMDLRHLDEAVVKGKLAQVYQTMLRFVGMDPLKELIPIRPAAHFTMGGIDVTDFRTCRTEIPNLFAAGECACVSVHGANRLGGNALTEIMVFGKLAGEHGWKCAVKKRRPDVAALAAAREKYANRSVPQQPADLYRRIVAMRAGMAEALWNRAGILRDEQGLNETLQMLRELAMEYQQSTAGMFWPAGREAWSECLEFGNMLDVAMSVVLAAMERKESRGSHNRTDCPDLNPAWLRHTLVRKRPEGWRVEYRPLNQYPDADGGERPCQ